MDCISKEQLIEELRAYRAQLQGDVEFFSINVGWWGRAKLDAVKAELSDVQAFLASLVKPVANVAQTGSKAPRCSHYKAIRRTFAIAKDRGLDTKDESAMRRAFGRALGRRIESRNEMSGGDWDYVARQMKRGALAW